ncbi:protein FAR-RED IMPAIRED RESPONSE 1-like [Setaria italica]|uniref:protein FAR-RED IMPAIRED RESPONSE 1-like n=1 Tax=Setaria italica TaxID=4555 RepID=UPI00035130F3|nr:protein FAR-RED IMPAIRED RESPONSE 1-like [Setaria italica]
MANSSAATTPRGEGTPTSLSLSVDTRNLKFRDMQETLDYFVQLQEEDPDFYYKTFQLGCAFIRDEKTPSYVWLFETFLEAMKGKAPLNIITDQDGAMRSAIAQAMPNTNHRNCRWHIMDNFSGTIGPVLEKDEKLEDDFKECVNHTVTPAEFEAEWAAMISKYGLHENEHFQRLYAIRSSFVPAYFMHCFCPFLQSTQRSEGFNAVLKKYVNPNMSILNFVRQYQKIQKKCLVAQDGQDFRTDDRERRRWSKYPIERHARAGYTKNLFYRFSKEFEKTAEYDVNPEGSLHYLLVPNNFRVYGYGKRSYLGTAIEEEENFYYECSKFDRDGMLCCHVMKVLTILGVKQIPDRYILKRWTQKAVENTEKSFGGASAQPDFIARGMPLTSKKTLWFTNLSTAFAELAAEDCVSKERYTLMQNHIAAMRSEVDETKRRKKNSRQHRTNIAASVPAVVSATDGAAGSSAMLLSTTSAPTTGNMAVPVGNPPRSKVKGRKKERRLKKGMNVEPKRKNKCRLCRSTDHNAARCPKKAEGEPERGLT